jgi:hypothetical protein
LQENIDILENKGEQKLRSLVHNIIKEALDENVDEAMYQGPVSIKGKVKEMPDKGVTGVEKKVRLKEEIKWERNSINENAKHDDENAKKAKIWNKLSADEKLDNLLSVIKNPDKAEKYVKTKWDNLPDTVKVNMTLEEQKLRSLIQQIIKEELEEANLGHNEIWSLEPEGRFWILTYSTADRKKEKTFDSEVEAKNWIKQNLDK